MKQLKAFWSLLDGKKTIVASLYWGFVMPSLAVLYPNGVPADINKWVTIVGFFLTALGLGHKYYKNSAMSLLLCLAVVVGIGGVGCSKKATKIDTATLSTETLVQTPQREQRRYAAKPQQDPIGTAVTYGSTPITVYFAFDSYDLSDEVKGKLETFAAQNMHKAVAVYGGCCPIGTEEYNEALGLLRAQAVADYLAERQVLVAHVESWGETILAARADNEWHLNRRAEVKPQ